MSRQRPAPEIVQARKREIAHRYKRGRQRSSPRQIAALRVHDLGRLYRARYGSTLPDDDAGREDALIALQHLAGMPQGVRRCQVWLNAWAPWMTNAEAEQMIGDAALRGRAWSADQLAWRLGLNMADRTALGITTIGAVDCNKGQRTKLRKAKDRERKRLARLRLKSASAP